MNKSIATVWWYITTVANWFWMGVCWLAIPAVFGLLLYESFSREVSVTQFCLAAAAVSPWILRFLSRFLSEFNIGPSGVSGKTREAVKNKDEVEPPTVAPAKDEQPPPAASSSEATSTPEPPLSAQALKMIRTLWKFQVEQFGPDDIRRWGFTVGTGSPNYMEFSLGMLQLLQRHLVDIDNRGFVFLTNAGVMFCKTYNQYITAYPHYFCNFSN